MSKVISIRIPNNLYQQLKESDKNIKDVVILALERFFYYEDLAVTPVNEKKNELTYQDIATIVDTLILRRWGDSDG